LEKTVTQLTLAGMADTSLLIAAAMTRITGIASTVERLARLSGGANMESSAFDYDGQGYVLRRAPSPEMMEGRPFGHEVEAAIVRAARASGVTAPEVVGALEPDDGLGTGYVMRRVEAEVNPAKILADPPSSLIADFARELARIHRVPLEKVPGVPTMDTAAALADLKARYLTYGGDRPIIALAIKWCEDHVPMPAPLALVHGDFRMGNLMVDGHGLAAVLDWELAHLGDAHEDLAWGCVNAWRFGHIDLPAFGCASLDTYFCAYEAESGTKVDRARFRFWLIYRTLWWAMGCLQMGEIWRSGIDKSLERAVIGRRTSENECDLLMLLEEDAPETQRLPIRLDPPPPPRRQGEPSTVEMLEAISGWIEADIKPGAVGRDKFMAAVALNALGMLRRAEENPVDVHDKMLSDDILAGRKTLATPGLLAKLRKDALAKLANDVPKYSALTKARELWGAG
jgi:aminoglycoside phosphotransferase (APT) family kinase protein